MKFLKTACKNELIGYNLMLEYVFRQIYIFKKGEQRWTDKN